MASNPRPPSATLLERREQAKVRATDAKVATAEAAQKVIDVKANTAKLKTLRLARDEAERVEALKRKPTAKRRTKAKAAAQAIPVEKLDASNAAAEEGRAGPCAPIAAPAGGRLQ